MLLRSRTLVALRVRPISQFRVVFWFVDRFALVDCDPSPTWSCECTLPLESIQGGIEGNLWLMEIIPGPTSTSSTYIGRPLEPKRVTCVFIMADRYTFDFHTVATHLLCLFVRQNCVFFYFGTTELSRDLRAQLPAQLRAFTVFSSLSSRFRDFLTQHH